MFRNLPVLLSFACSAVSASVAWSETEAPEWVIEYAQQSKEQRPLALAESERKLGITSKKLKEAKKSRRDSAAEKRAAIQQASEWVAKHSATSDRLRDPLEPFFATFPKPPIKAGATGVFPEKVRVLQVVGDSDCLVEFETVRYVSVGKRTAKGTPYRSTEPRYSQHLMWISRVDTSEMFDNKSAEFPGVYRVIGNKTYSTAAGSSNTVPKAEPVSVDMYKQLFTRADECRTWTSSSGKHSTEAVFVRYDKGKVHLKRLDGKEASLKLSDLSRDDQKFVREQIERD